MKQITLLIMLLCLTVLGIAQEEVAIEQTIDQPIGYLEIGAGWEVRLMHRNTDSYRLAVVVPERFAGIANETRVCNLAGDTLTILENTILPKGTIVELEGRLGFRKINAFDKATAMAEQIDIPENADPVYIELGEKANLSIKKLVCQGDPHFEMGERSRLSIDTICGRGNIHIARHNAEFHYGTSLKEGTIYIDIYERPSWFYVKENPIIITTKLENGQPVTTERNRIWDNALAIGLGVGYRNGLNPVNLNSPYTSSSGGLDVHVGLLTRFVFTPHLSLSTGLQVNLNKRRMDYPVKLGENGLEVIENPEMTQHDELVSSYLCIPAELYYYFDKSKSLALSMDIKFGYLVGARHNTRFPQIGDQGSIGENARSLFNPWKLEAGISIITNVLGIIHGVRVYTNLLPEYNKAVTTEKFRSIGLEIKF
jgi:hypothetical protein